jgi:hypothetical protein
MSISLFHANEIIEGSNTSEDTEGGGRNGYFVNRGGCFDLKESSLSRFQRPFSRASLEEGQQGKR